MAYEMRMSDWSSDVCSSDLHGRRGDLRFRGPTLKRLKKGALPGEGSAPSFTAMTPLGGGSCHGGSAGREGLWGVARQFSAGADSDPTASDRPLQALALPRFPSQPMIHHNGRASCRERGGQYV